MVECAGEAVELSLGAVTGKLSCGSVRTSGKSSAATILLWGAGAVIDERRLSEVVGVVFSSRLESEIRRRIGRTARLFKIPALCIGDDEALLCGGEGKVAILDCSRQRLYVDPDIDTVSRYFLLRREQSKRQPDVLMRWESGCESRCDGYLVGESLSEDTDEDAAYEYFCEIADRSTGIRLVASVDCEMEAERLRARIRAVYRAGVWGRFSLLCTGICTPAEVERTLFSIHGAFRELDAKGREFNGFMPKGMTVQTPALLLNTPGYRFFDFICIDYPALLQRFTGRADGGGSERLVREYIQRFIDGAGNAKISVSIEREHEEVVRELGAVSEIYVGG